MMSKQIKLKSCEYHVSFYIQHTTSTYKFINFTNYLTNGWRLWCPVSEVDPPLSLSLRTYSHNDITNEPNQSWKCF